MKEIIYEEKFKGDKCESGCPNCGQPLYHTTIPCPDQKEGCLVIHYGYKCYGCGKIYR